MFKINNYKKPDICIPLTGKNLNEIKDQLALIIPKQPNLLELRADYLEEIADKKSVLEIVNYISKQTNIPLLFTIRSSREGGEDIPLNELEVLNLLKIICRQTNVKMIDYEVANNKENVTEIIACAQNEGKEVILSYHNFAETPASEDLIDKLYLMEDLGANHAKIAVMPNNQADVFRLLDISYHLSKQLSIPLTILSMGELGKLSRVIGWMYGSRITFAIGVESSAPGQIAIKELQHSIDSTYKIIKKES